MRGLYLQGGPNIKKEKKTESTKSIHLEYKLMHSTSVITHSLWKDADKTANPSMPGRS